MKMTLKAFTTVPYGSDYAIPDPITGVVCHGATFNMLMRHMYEQRKANGIPIGLEFESEIETLVCEKYPAECQAENPNERIRSVNLGIHDIMVGTSVMGRFLASGRKLVDQVEAERRASICVGCQYNVTFAKPCHGICAELAQLVNTLVGAVGTSKDASLHACAICRCFLRAAVYIPLEMQIAPLSETQKKQFATVPNCWKKLPPETNTNPS